VLTVYESYGIFLWRLNFRLQFRLTAALGFNSQNGPSILADSPVRQAHTRQAMSVM